MKFQAFRSDLTLRQLLNAGDINTLDTVGTILNEIEAGFAVSDSTPAHTAESLKEKLKALAFQIDELSFRYRGFRLSREDIPWESLTALKGFIELDGDNDEGFLDKYRVLCPEFQQLALTLREGAQVLGVQQERYGRLDRALRGINELLSSLKKVNDAFKEKYIIVDKLQAPEHLHEKWKNAIIQLKQLWQLLEAIQTEDLPLYEEILAADTFLEVSLAPLVSPFLSHLPTASELQAVISDMQEKLAETWDLLGEQAAKIDVAALTSDTVSPASTVVREAEVLAKECNEALTPLIEAINEGVHMSSDRLGQFGDERLSDEVLDQHYYYPVHPEGGHYPLLQGLLQPHLDETNRALLGDLLGFVDMEHPQVNARVLWGHLRILHIVGECVKSLGVDRNTDEHRFIWVYKRFRDEFEHCIDSANGRYCLLLDEVFQSKLAAQSHIALKCFQDYLDDPTTLPDVARLEAFKQVTKELGDATKKPIPEGLEHHPIATDVGAIKYLLEQEGATRGFKIRDEMNEMSMQLMLMWIGQLSKNILECDPHYNKVRNAFGELEKKLVKLRQRRIHYTHGLTGKYEGKNYTFVNSAEEVNLERVLDSLGEYDEALQALDRILSIQALIVGVEDRAYDLWSKFVLQVRLRIEQLNALAEGGDMEGFREYTRPWMQDMLALVCEQEFPMLATPVSPEGAAVATPVTSSTPEQVSTALPRKLMQRTLSAVFQRYRQGGVLEAPSIIRLSGSEVPMSDPLQQRLAELIQNPKEMVRTFIKSHWEQLIQELKATLLKMITYLDHYSALEGLSDGWQAVVEQHVKISRVEALRDLLHSLGLEELFRSAADDDDLLSDQLSNMLIERWLIHTAIKEPRRVQADPRYEGYQFEALAQDTSSAGSPARFGASEAAAEAKDAGSQGACEQKSIAPPGTPTRTPLSGKNLFGGTPLSRGDGSAADSTAGAGAARDSTPLPLSRGLFGSGGGS